MWTLVLKRPKYVQYKNEISKLKISLAVILCPVVIGDWHLSLELTVIFIFLQVDATEGEPKSFIYMSEDALTNPEKIMVLIQGSGVVRAGQWARRLIINEDLNSGTQIPFINRAKEVGFILSSSFFLQREVFKHDVYRVTFTFCCKIIYWICVVLDVYFIDVYWFSLFIQIIWFWDQMSIK